MTAAFDHVVLTRFNVRMPMYDHPPEGWLESRLSLFRRYTLPSMLAQTGGDVRWLLLFDASTSEPVRAEVAALRAASGERFEVVYVDEVFTAETASRIVADVVTADHVITTRLDNDDAVARDFVATVQRQFASQDLLFVNLVSGAQWCAGRTYRRPYTKNPFVSLVERRTDAPLRTVFTARHFAIDQAGPVLNVRTPHPSWLQVIHEGNVLNEVVGLRTRAARVAPWFGCEIDTVDEGLGYHLDRAGGVVRIVGRLVRQPHRITELARATLARSAGMRAVRPFRRAAPAGGVSRRASA